MIKKRQLVLYLLGAVFVVCFALLYLAIQEGERGVLLVEDEMSPAAQRAFEISEDCQLDATSDRQHCISLKIYEEIDHNPEQTGPLFDAFWHLAVSGDIEDDPRIFSDMVHEMGMVLVQKDISVGDAFSYCGESFKQGCMHGVIMEYVDVHYQNDIGPGGLIEICDDFENVMENDNCLHGVGHMLAAKIDSPLESVLGECERAESSLREVRACESGVLMEYSKGDAGSGFHSHAPTGSIELPCDTVDESYKSVCYGSAGSYRQYHPNQEPFFSSYTFCASALAPYDFHCMLGVSERGIIATAKDPARTYNLCDGLDGKARSLCVESLVQVSRTQFGDEYLAGGLEEMYDVGTVK